MTIHTKQSPTTRTVIIIPAIMLLLTITAGFILSSSYSHAETSSATASVTVPDACTLTGTVTEAHTKTMLAGTLEEGIGKTTIKAVCNDPNGFDIYAIGYSNNIDGNTNMIGSNGINIATGLNTGSDTTTSNWAMKLSLSDNNTIYTPNILSDNNGSYAEYHIIPSTSTKVATYNAITDSSPTSIGSNIDTTYRVYLSPTQPAGTYAGQVKYTITHPTTTFTYYMQDFTTEMCETLGQATEKTITLYDKRDNNSYTVAYINGQCWMTQNLRFTGTSILSATSNVTTDKTMTYYDLETDGTSGGKCRDFNGYDNACIKNSDSTATGVWYNYYAATAGTISGPSNDIASTEDICPKNWHLPTGPNTIADTDFNKLVGNTISGLQDPTAGLTAFSAIAGGRYSYGSLTITDYGFWWSSTARNAIYRYSMCYYVSDDQFGDGSNNRYSGFFVRCVHN